MKRRTIEYLERKKFNKMIRLAFKKLPGNNVYFVAKDKRIHGVQAEIQPALITSGLKPPSSMSIFLSYEIRKQN